MTRDAEMRATDFVHLVLRNIGSETDPWGLTALPRFASLAKNFYSAPDQPRAAARRVGGGPAGAGRLRRGPAATTS